MTSLATNQVLPGGIRHLYREALKKDLRAHRRPAWGIMPEHLVVAYEAAEQYRKKTLKPGLALFSVFGCFRGLRLATMRLY